MSSSVPEGWEERVSRSTGEYLESKTRRASF